MSRITKVYKCTCEGQGVSVQDWYDQNEIWLSFWSIGNFTLSWIQRIKEAFRIFKTGEQYPDMVILEYNTARDFAQHILMLVEKEQKCVKSES